MPPSWRRFSIAVFTNTDWSNTTSVTRFLGVSSRPATTFLTPSTTAMVLESPPCLSTGRYTEPWLLTRTLLTWICEPSTALPTSATSTEALPTVLSGRALMSFIALIWLLA